MFCYILYLSFYILYLYVIHNPILGYAIMQLPDMIKSMFFYTRKRYNASHKFRTKNAIQPPKHKAVEEINPSTIDIKIEK